jgi:hypothetical protein
VEATGAYDGRAWLGDIWTLRNVWVTSGLIESGYHDLAAELSWSTIKAFHRNYAEYLAPSTGSGEGVARYGWTAAQYIQSIVEHLFGVDYDRARNRLRIFPHVPPELARERLALRGLLLPDGARLDVTVHQGEVSARVQGKLAVKSIDVVAALPAQGRLRAESTRGAALPLQPGLDGAPGAAGVRLPAACAPCTVRFRVVE